MAVEKTKNETETANLRYEPEYTHDTSKDHHDNSVVVWLGNNGRLTTTIDTGIALTKAVTEAIGDANDTYALTVTVPSNVTATPVVKDANGNDVTAAISTYLNNVLTVNVKSGETVYVSGIPGGTECAIDENIPDSADYYIASNTNTVTIPTLSEVLNGTSQFVTATVTNAPNKYGNLYITKEIESTHTIPDSILDKEFTVTVNVGSALANKKYTVQDSAASQPYEITVDTNGNIDLTIKARQTIEILNLPEGTIATVTEALTTEQDAIFDITYRTRNHTGENADTDNQVTIPAGANATAVITNTYTPKSTDVDLDIAGTKVFGTESDDSQLPGGTFDFKVQQWDSANSKWVDINGKTASTEYNAGEHGTKIFEIKDVLDGITYKEAGSWAYQVLEVKGNVSNITYDRTLYTFTVTVTDNDGQLVATVTDLNNTAITDGSYEVTFNNTYHTAPVSIDIVKDVVNESGDPDISKAGFAFTAVQTDKDWKVLSGGSTLTVSSDAAGEARLTATYTEKGTYYYVVTELDKGANGWSYSDAEYHVTVTVTENNGDLTSTMTIVAKDGTTVTGESTSVTGNSGKIFFINTYDPQDVTVDLDMAVKKQLKNKTLEAGEFTFNVYKNGTTDAVLIGTNDANGNVDFKDVNSTAATDDDVLIFNKVGKYEYDIVEVKGSAPGITYDSTIYDLVVEVTNDTATGKLVAKYYFEDATTQTVTFNNVYTVTPTEYTISATKILNGRAMAAGEFSFELWE